MPIARRLEKDAQLMEFRCQEMAGETMLGHLRKRQLVTQWERRTMRIDVTRKAPQVMRDTTFTPTGIPRLGDRS